MRNSDSDTKMNATMAASKAFDKIIDCVKSSNLNFCLQLSPFSATISVKKTLIKDKAGFYLSPSVTDLSLQPKQDLPGIKIKELEDIVADLKLRLADSVTECEKANEMLAVLENKLKIKQESRKSKENDLENDLNKKLGEISLLSDEKKQLKEQLDYSQTLINKRDAEIQNLKQNLKTSNCAVTKLNKKLVEIQVTHKDQKKQMTKDFKSELKFWKKNLGEERSEKIKIRKKLDNIQNNFNEKVSNSCQTNTTLDVPYLVTEPLPPIFGSQLLQKSKIQQLSRSLPNLSTLVWAKVTEDDLILEAAEEALNKQYDDRIEQFYEEAKAKATALREVYDGNCISKLFDDVS